jgi:hypothetical protein
LFLTEFHISFRRSHKDTVFAIFLASQISLKSKNVYKSLITKDIKSIVYHFKIQQDVFLLNLLMFPLSWLAFLNKVIFLDIAQLVFLIYNENQMNTQKKIET